MSLTKAAVTVKTRSKTYPIFITEEGPEAVFAALGARFAGRRLAVVTDRNIADLYAKSVGPALARAGHRPQWILIPPGEKHKTRRTKEIIEDALLEEKVDRKTLLVAFGGGVVGDLTGFVAATCLRGLDFVQVPTTLLSMVDSSVGGKTGVDTPHGKNLIGAFWQPEAVYASSAFLKTLPREQILSGLGEVLKYGFIGDAGFDRWLGANVKPVLALKGPAVMRVLRTSIDAKRRVVGEDERETGGLRRTLNFGHTAGHAVELLSNFKLPHGACVAIGMAVEAEVAVGLGILPEKSRDALLARIAAYGLPTAVPKKLNVSELYRVMLSDKKSTVDTVKAALIRDIGKSIPGAKGDYAIPVPKAEWDRAFRKYQG